MTDFLLLEKISELNNSLKKPRLLHRKGVTVRGVFRPYMSMEDFTKAEFLQDPDEVTPVIVRFSKMAGEAGSADSLRDIRGFACRFITDIGNYDLLCYNMPLYYINDPVKLPQLLEHILPDENGLSDSKKFWHFLGQNPEAINLAMWLYSNRGTIKTYRNIEGYSIMTYQWKNAEGMIFYVRYRWKPMEEGVLNNDNSRGISYQEAEFLAGFAPDCCTRDLHQAIEEKCFPAYELQVQIIEKEKIEDFGFDLLSPTLLWPEEKIPYMKVGRLEINEKYDPHQKYDDCFTPSNLVEGIGFTDSNFLRIMDFAHKDSGRQRGADKW